MVYLAKRLLALVPVCLGVVAVVSLLIYLVPGDPVDEILGPLATLQQKETLRRELGLDGTPLDRLLRYVGGIVRGDFGTSLINRAPVLRLIGDRVGPTLELTLVALAVATCISLPLGIISALNRRRLVDYVAMTFALLGVAAPSFWVGPMLVLFFAVWLGWLPVSERTSLASYVLPSLTMGTALAAALSRITRASVLDNLSQEYVTTARAKGNSERRVVGKHVLRNALLPVVTVMGLQFGALMTGAIITEQIFDWPGLGTLFIQSVRTRDYPVVQGCVLLFSMTYLVVNLLTDLCYSALDPRVRFEK